MTAKGVHNNLVRNLEHWQSIALPGSVKLSDESLPDALALPIPQSLYILYLFPMTSVTYLRMIIHESPCLAGTRSLLLGRMYHLPRCAYNII